MMNLSTPFYVFLVSRRGARLFTFRLLSSLVLITGRPRRIEKVPAFTLSLIFLVFCSRVICVPSVGAIAETQPMSNVCSFRQVKEGLFPGRL